jgi:2-octaprenyl-6-methoxyphenol hydroxylase
MKLCILGDSLSSFALAKALVNRKIYVEVFSQNKQLLINKTRTIGISESNVNFFNQKILNIEKIIWKLNKIEIFTDNLRKEKIIKFENKNKYLFSIVKNHELIDLLKKKLEKNKYFRLIYSKNNFSYKKYDLVINTDQNNYLTKKFFNKKVIKKYNSFAYTAVIKHEKIINNIATQIFTKRGPIAFLPVSDRETSIVYSVHNLNNNKINIKKLIEENNIKYKIKKIGQIEKFELKSLTLRSYYHENILAFGDLLHKIHPLAGQGFNMTIRDIMIFTNIIQKKISLGLPLDKSVNIEFEKKSRHKNFVFSNGVDLIHEIFNLERKTKSNIISKSIQILGKNPSINKFFTEIADKGIII